MFATELAAVSGQTFVDPTLPEMKTLTDLLTWACNLDEGTYVVQASDGTIDADRPETREKFVAYFEQTGSRSFLALPLRDDEGCLGVLALEAAEPYAFSERDLEVAGLLGVQATVALRNAVLYARMPMARVFQSQGRADWIGSGWRRRLARIGVLALAAAVLILVPLPLRVGGAARVLPEQRLAVTSEVEGRIAEVFVREGDRVGDGEVLARLDEAELQVAREAAHARYQVALRERERFRADGSPSETAVQTARVEGLRAELDLWEARLARTRLRAPVAGLVATPRVEELAGTRIAAGDVFCEVVDPDHQRIEIAVPEADAGLLGAGMSVKVKLFAYPTRSFHGTVERVGVTAAMSEGKRVFLVRTRLEDAEVVLRSGMTGKAKINTGTASLGRVIFRRPARWVWGLLWGWLP